MGGGVLLQSVRDDAGERRHVLRVLDDGEPLAMLVGLDAGEALEHLVALDGETALRGMDAGKNGAPDGMGVKDAAGIALANDFQVERGFGGGLAFSAKNVAGVIDLEKLFRGEGALVEPGGGDSEEQWVAVQSCAEITACAEDPATRVELATNVAEP